MQTCLQSNCNLELASRIELGGGSFGAGERPSGFPPSELFGSAGFLCFSLWVCVSVFVRLCVSFRGRGAGIYSSSGGDLMGLK